MKHADKILAMCKIVCIAFPIGGFVFPNTAIGDPLIPETVQQATYDCRDENGYAPDDQMRKYWFCFGVFQAVRTTTMVACGATKVHGAPRGYGADIPSEISLGALRQIFFNWAELHPEHWHLPFAMGVMEAYSEKFPPCAKLAE